MNEDACQISRGDGAENLARLRQITVNILKKETEQIKSSLQETPSRNEFSVFG